MTLTAPVKAGDMVVLSSQASQGSSKKVSATDSAGDLYSVALEQIDSTGAELSLLCTRATQAMAAGSTITVSFPASTTYRITADELTGVTTLDRTSAATGRTSTFSSGATRTTAAAVSLTGGRKSACGR